MSNPVFPGGVWPVMLTPFTERNAVDYPALEALTDWYIEQGSSGLFAVCQSSEMFFLSLEERVRVAQTVVRRAAGRVPVIASGHIADVFDDQVTELNAMAHTGIDALILITNRLAAENESDAVWRERCARLIDAIDTELPLGFYECPYPYKRLLSIENIRWAAATGRFHFLKDTCCDIEQIREKLSALRGTPLRLYNANVTTLLESLRAGAAGFSGVMASFHAALYARLCETHADPTADALSDFLTIAALIERQCYPVNAKYHLMRYENLPMGIACRTRDASELADTMKNEVAALNRMAREWMKSYS